MMYVCVFSCWAVKELVQFNKFITDILSVPIEYIDQAETHLC